MAIEFPCSECGKLLSVPDGSEGRQARCPACSAVCAIPAAGQLSSQHEAGASGTPDGSDNPYAAPSDIAADSDFVRPKGEDTGRDGPPWERDGMGVGSFVATVKEMFSGPSGFGRRMRRTGGFGASMAFGVVGGFIATLIGLALEWVVGDPLGGDPQGFDVAWPIVVIIAVPILALSLLIHAAIVHFMLSVLGHARQDFETTFRVIAYTTGSSNLLAIIPGLGGLIGLVVQIVFSILTLAEAHEISGGKAAAAVLIPVAVCFVALIGLGIALAAMIQM